MGGRWLQMMKARENILSLVDEMSFVEMNPDIESGIVCGYATISSRPVYVFSQDSSCFSGALSENNCRKLCKLFENVYKTGVPMIGIFDSMGTKIAEGMKAVSGIHEVLVWLAKLSGVVPIISIIANECAGAASYMATFGDFVVMFENSYMFLNSPQKIMADTGKTVQLSDIGGVKTHQIESGLCDVICKDFSECALKLKTLLNYLPENNLTDAPIALCDEIKEFRIESDVKSTLNRLCDENSFWEISENFADSVTGFGRVGGRACGIVALMTDLMSIKDINKICRFVRICDSFNLPLITVLDGKGIMADLNSERCGVIRDVSKLVYAYCMASVPKINIILKNAYGSTLLILGTNPDVTIALKSAQVAIMDPQAAATVLYDNEITNAEEPIKMRENYAREYAEKFGTAESASQELFADILTDEVMLRAQLVQSLDLFVSKRFEKVNKKHGNII